MSRSAIYTTNSSVQEVPLNGIINPGTVIRRFGCNLYLSGNGIREIGEGYYEYNITVTAASTAAGEVTITAYKDGVAIPGATASETVAAADDLANLSLDFILREPCACCEDGGSSITFVLTGTASNVNNIAIAANKI